MRQGYKIQTFPTEGSTSWTALLTIYIQHVPLILQIATNISNLNSYLVNKKKK